MLRGIYLRYWSPHQRSTVFFLDSSLSRMDCSSSLLLFLADPPLAVRSGMREGGRSMDSTPGGAAGLYDDIDPYGHAPWAPCAPLSDLSASAKVSMMEGVYSAPRLSTAKERWPPSKYTTLCTTVMERRVSAKCAPSSRSTNSSPWAMTCTTALNLVNPLRCCCAASSMVGTLASPRIFSSLSLSFRRASARTSLSVSYPSGLGSMRASQSMLCLSTPCTKLLALGVATHGHTHTGICAWMAPVMDIVPPMEMPERQMRTPG
mmetsp:Transcript_14242/g.30508  ORF Transcript_14242/g.30508 Transcript_14242/m.30508 type:complete len:262 (-) Transcript_14242:853-1638(-)